MKKRFVSFMLSLMIIISFTQITLAKQNNDEPASWAINEVREAEDLMLVPSSMKNSYSKIINRGEFCTLAITCIEQISKTTIDQYITSLGITIPQTSPFRDVEICTENTKKYILAAYALKIVNGTSDNTFAPENSITREQAAKMLTATASSLNNKSNDNAPVFADNDKISDWAKPYIGYVFSAKIMSGVGSNKFDPTGGYQRQQAYMTMLRLYRYISSKVSSPPVFSENHRTVEDEIITSNSTNIDTKSITMSKVDYEKTSIIEGSILTAGVTEKTPNGFLKKVTRVKSQGNSVILETVDAELNELIKDADIKFSKELTKNDIKLVNFKNSRAQLVSSSGDSMRLLASNSKYLPLALASSGSSSNISSEIVIGFNDYILYDKDAKSDTTEDSIKLNGSVQIKPSLDLDISISNNIVGSIYFEVKNSIDCNLNITGDISASWNEKAVVGTIHFTPITIHSLVFTPSIDIVVGTDGNVTGHFYYGTKQKSTLLGWAKYTKNATDLTDVYGNWDGGINGGKDDTNEFYEPTFSGSVEAKIYAGTEGKILLYGAIGGAIGLYPYIKASANPRETPWWKVKIGLEGMVSFEALVKEYNKFFPIYEKTLLDASYYDKESGGKYKVAIDNEGWGKYYKISSIDESLTSDSTGYSFINDDVVVLKRLKNGDFLMAGRNNNGKANRCAFIMRTDKTGKLLWSKYVGYPTGVTGDKTNLGNIVPRNIDDVLENSDGTLMILGSDRYHDLKSDSNTSTFLAKTKSDGTVLWSKKIEAKDVPDVYFSGRTGVRSILKNDQGFVILLKTAIVSVDGSGKVLKSKKVSIDGNSSLGLYDLKSDLKGNLYAVGIYDVLNPDPVNMSTLEGCVVKFDKSLNKIWEKSITSGNKTTTTSLDIDVDGNIYIPYWGTRFSNQDPNFMGLLKLDSNGGKIWAKEVDYDKKIVQLFVASSQGLKVTSLDNKGVVVYGTGFDGDSRIIKFDSATGKVDWFKYVTYADSKDNVLVSTRSAIVNDATFDGKLIYFAGATNSFSQNVASMGTKYPRYPLLFSTSISGSITLKEGANMNIINISANNIDKGSDVKDFKLKITDSDVVVKSDGDFAMLNSSYITTSFTKD